MRRTVLACAGLALWCALAATARAQDSGSQPFKVADQNLAVIQGRVTLPSGLAAKRYIKITVRNSQSLLYTLYTNEQGEFQLRNLSEGTYYVQAEVQDESFEPAVSTVSLGRGLTVQLTLELRDKRTPVGARVVGPRVVSAAELQQAVPAAAKKEYELGAKLAFKGDLQRAAAHFERAISLYPEYLVARNDLGAQYLKLKRLDEAEKLFQFVLERDPKNFNAKFNQGLVRMERQDYLNAMAQLRQAIAIDPTRPVARLWLGIAMLETGDLANAEVELMKALVMGGEECAAANYHMARIYFGRGDTAEAARSVRLYLKDAPKGEFAENARQLQKSIQEQASARSPK